MYLQELTKDLDITDTNAMNEAAEKLAQHLNSFIILNDQNYAAISKITGEHPASCHCSGCDAVHDYEVENNLIDGYDADYDSMESKML